MNNQLASLQSYLENSNFVKRDIRTAKILQNQGFRGILTVGNLHKEQIITDENYQEIKFIPKTLLDSIFDHFGLLFLGACTGYFPPDLNSELREEIEFILQVEEIREYYSTGHQKRFIMDAVAGYCAYFRVKGVNPFLANPLKNQDPFNELLALNLSLKTDPAVLKFLGLLATSDEFNIKSILSDAFSSGLVSKYEEKGITTEDKQIVAEGAFKFASFIEGLYLLLEKYEGQEIIQSILWNFYGNIFQAQKQKLTASYDLIFDKIGDKIRHNSNELLPRSDFASEEELRQIIDQGLTQSSDALHALLYGNYNKALEKAVKKHLESINERVLEPA